MKAPSGFAGGSEKVMLFPICTVLQDEDMLTRFDRAPI